MIDRVGFVGSPGSKLPTKAKAEPPVPDPLKGGDVYKWALDQAALIHAGRYQDIDWINVADEIEGVGKFELRALRSNLQIVLLHMLKWDHQPERRTRSWITSINVHRVHVDQDLDESPSLKSKLNDIIGQAYKAARVEAAGETNKPLETLGGSYDADLRPQSDRRDVNVAMN